LGVDDASRGLDRLLISQIVRGRQHGPSLIDVRASIFVRHLANRFANVKTPGHSCLSGKTPGIGARLPTYRFITRNSAAMAAWLVVIE
jgi:hypothetical protein